MPRKAPPPSGRDSKTIFRYWVELLDLHSGTRRNLPLQTMRRVCLKAGKKGEPLPLGEQYLQLIDDAVVIEARDLEDLRGQLRLKYPDEGWERRLFYERDRDAERQREAALNSLARIFAEAALEEIPSENAQQDSIHRPSLSDAPASHPRPARADP